MTTTGQSSARPESVARRATPPDPRLRARRVEVRRVEGRRRLHRVLALGAFVGAVVLVLAVLHSPLLAARDVTVVGGSRTGRQAILAATGLERHPPLVDVSPAADEAALRRLPWVRTAVVRRSWPSGVEVVVTERSAVAEVPLTSGSYALVDPTGRVLEDTAVRVRELPLVTGTASVPPPGRWLPAASSPAIAVAGALPVAVLPRIAAVVGLPGGDVELRLASGPTVVLGPADGLGAKMTALTTVLDRVALRGIVTIDLRVPADPVLTS
ncbi:MAG: cell division protein FtsQ/DivIB [Acidimicrobiales bacterium]